MSKSTQQSVLFEAAFTRPVQVAFDAEALTSDGAVSHDILHNCDECSPRGHSPVPGPLDVLGRGYVPGPGFQRLWEPRPFRDRRERESASSALK